MRSYPYAHLDDHGVARSWGLAPELPEGAVPVPEGINALQHWFDGTDWLPRPGYPPPEVTSAPTGGVILSFASRPTGGLVRITDAQTGAILTETDEIEIELPDAGTYCIETLVPAPGIEADWVLEVN